MTWWRRESGYHNMLELRLVSPKQITAFVMNDILYDFLRLVSGMKSSQDGSDELYDSSYEL